MSPPSLRPIRPAPFFFFGQKLTLPHRSMPTLLSLCLSSSSHLLSDSFRGRVGFPWQQFPLPVCVKASTPLKLSAPLPPSVFLFGLLSTPPFISRFFLQRKDSGSRDAGNGGPGAQWKWDLNPRQSRKRINFQQKQSLHMNPDFPYRCVALTGNILSVCLPHAARRKRRGRGWL